MSSLTGALNTANSALMFNQNAISTVSRNVANANTVGYTRQSIVSENQVLNGEGQGVSSGTIVRYADQILQTNADKQSAELNYNQTKANYFEVIENKFGKLSASNSTTATLGDQISDMFTQLNNLVEDPTLSSNKVTFKNATLQTTQRLNQLANDLSNTQIDLDDQVSDDLLDINIALKNISDLNKQISQVERENGNSSDLKDLRQKEIDVVAANLQVTVSEKENGVVHLTLNSGKVLVDSTYVELSRTSGTPFGGIGMTRIKDGIPSNTTQVLDSDDLSTGGIGALVDLRDNEIPNLISQLDNFAVEFIEQFNNIHAQGSAIPAPSILSGVQQENGGSTLLSDIGLVAGTDFDVSVVDANGDALFTTANLDYTGSIGASTVTGVSTGTFDPEAYLAANGSTAQIGGTSNLEYLGANTYRLTDPSGSIYTATISPATFPVGATPAELTFANGVSLNVDSGTTEPTVGNIGTIDLQVDGGPIRIEDGDTLDDLAAKINSNPALSAGLTASVVGGALQISAADSNNGIVLGNDPTGSTFNSLGFNRYFEGDSAATMTVSSNITSDLNNIATARMRDDGGLTSTNNENIVNLVNLQNTSFSFSAAGGLNSQNSTLTEYFISITSTFAAEVSANSQQAEFNQSLYDDFTARVQSLSGVNTDEEFANLILYQRSYEASARMISTIDDMLETLINMV